MSGGNQVFQTKDWDMAREREDPCCVSDENAGEQRGGKRKAEEGAEIRI